MALSWETLRDLERSHGEAFFVLDLQAFRRNYNEFLDAFRAIYPRSRIAYSYKTNYIPRLCREVDRMGGYAEVVSGMEYDLALRVGVDPTRIIFNGPYKREDDLERSLLAGSIVNLDADYEVAALEDIARRHPRRQADRGLALQLRARRYPFVAVRVRCRGRWPRQGLRSGSSASTTASSRACIATSRPGSAASAPMPSARGGCSICPRAASGTARRASSTSAAATSAR